MVLAFWLIVGLAFLSMLLNALAPKTTEAPPNITINIENNVTGGGIDHDREENELRRLIEEKEAALFGIDAGNGSTRRRW